MERSGRLFLSEKATSGNVSATYNGTYADINGGYSYDNHMRRLNYGVQGGVLLHRNGLTLSQPMDDTIILVKALAQRVSP